MTDNLIPPTSLTDGAPRLWDRSRATTDWKCPRARYWGYEYLGRGLSPTSMGLPLYMGTAIHDALAGIATLTSQGEMHMIDIDTIADTAYMQMCQALATDPTKESYAREQASLVEGLIRGFYRHVWPSLMAQYPDILLVEQELTLEHDGLTFMSKPDLVLANESEVLYYEYKSTSTKQDKWVNSWQDAVQIHSTIRSIEAHLQRKVTSVIVQGLYKGYSAYGKQSSPFCYGYHRTGTPPFSRSETQYEWKSGLKKFPVWEMDGGVKAWVEGMPTDILSDQFPTSPPIMVRDDLIDRFFAQRAIREKEIDMAMGMLEFAGDDTEMAQNILDTAFEQKFDQCTPAYGFPCSFRVLCHAEPDNPLSAGFQLRESHHDLERELNDAQL